MTARAVTFVAEIGYYMRILLILVLTLSASTSVVAQRFEEELLFDNARSLASFGIDSTGSWWAMYRPVESTIDLIVNGEVVARGEQVRSPKFSPDGRYWAATIVQAGQHILVSNVGSYVAGNDSIVDIRWTRQSNMLAIVKGIAANKSVVRFNIEELALETSGQKVEANLIATSEMEMNGFGGAWWISPRGRRVAWTTGVSGGKTMVVEGMEGYMFDDIIGAGFTNKGEMMYAGLLGGYWDIMRGSEDTGDRFAKVTEAVVNHAGNTTAFIVSDGSAQQIAVYNDQYNGVMISEGYQSLFFLSLHPTEPMYACIASEYGNNTIVFSGAEYGVNGIAAAPRFTSDGSMLYTLGCTDLDCFINLDGVTHWLTAQIGEDTKVAKNPRNNTISYSNTSTMIVRDYDSGKLFTSPMCDFISAPVYRWDSNTYKAIGVFGQRLLLITCRF